MRDYEELKEKLQNKQKLIQCIENDRVSLSVYECTCGFYLGIDSTFLEQVDEVRIACLSFIAYFIIKS